MKALYFGCGTQAGHYFWLPGMKSLPYHEGMALIPWGRVDGAFVRRFQRGEEQPQGIAFHWHKDGWTALSFWDRSQDSRGNSSSTFLFDSILTYHGALTQARNWFPEIFQRITFEIQPVTSYVYANAVRENRRYE